MKKIVRRTVIAVGVALVAAAVYRELQKPPEERTWQGSLGGTVPYDFRKPTLDRYRAAMWSPDDERVFTPRPFGVGWSVNVGRLVRLARERTAA